MGLQRKRKRHTPKFGNRAGPTNVFSGPKKRLGRNRPLLMCAVGLITWRGQHGAQRVGEAGNPGPSPGGRDGGQG
eukprot:10804376-Alexandrium_andersonii.AAC.1